MKIERITKKILIDLGACESGIKFFERNKLEGFPVELLNRVEGDYNWYMSWIRENINCEIEYDEKDNLIYKRYPNGDEYYYKYDERDNLIHEKNPDGDEYFYEYDERDNLIHEKNPDGDEYFYEYDERNNLIHEKYPNGDEYFYEYDERDNLIHEKNPDGDEYQYKYDERNNLIYENYSDGSESHYKCEYYSDRQLKRLNNLVIPYFEKEIQVWVQYMK